MTEIEWVSLSEPPLKPSSLTGWRLFPALTMKPFIPSSLDDYPLTPAQFRLFCHIARRDHCYESIPNMARHCLLNRDTAWNALKYLERQGLVSRSRRPGQTSLFCVNEETQWAPSGKEGAPPKFRYHPAEKEGWDPAEKEGYKGNPIKAIPLRGVPAPKVNGHARGQTEDPPAWKTEWDEMKGRL